MISKKHQKLLLFILLSLLCFAVAEAQTVSDLPTLGQMKSAALGPPKDESMRLLTGIFGEVAGNPLGSVGSASTLFGRVAFLFNGAIFVIGSGILVFQLIVLTAVSANDGTPLGNGKFDGVLMPLKNGFGILGMLPVFGGFSLFQALMILAITLGTGLGNMLWNTVLERTDAMESLMPSTAALEGAGAHSSGIERLGQTLFIANACHVAQEYKARARWNESGQFELLPKAQAAKHHNWTLFEDKRWLGESTRGIDFGACGRVAISMPKDSELRLNEGLQAVMGFRISPIDYRAIAQTVESAAYNELIDLNIDIRNQIEKWIGQYWGSNTSINEIYPLIQDYSTVISTSKARLNHSITETFRANKTALDPNLKANMKAGGWVSAGNWNSIFGEVGASLASAQSAYSYSYRPGTSVQKIITNTNSGEFYSVENLAAMLVKHFDNHQDSNQIKAFGECIYGGAETTAVGECSVGQNISGAILKLVAEDSGGTGLVNPVTASKAVGDYLMGTGETMLAVAAAAHMTNQIVGQTTASIPGGGVVTGVLDATVGNAAKIGFVLGGAMTAIGTYMSVFIPLMFFMAWFAAVLTWIITMFEAVLMAQIGAFSHVTIKDQGLMDGPSRKVYIYAFYALFAPSLLVIAWIVSQSISIYAGTLLFKWYLPVFSAAQGNSTTGLLTLIAAAIIFCIMLTGLISTLLTVFQMPRKLLGQLGESEASFSSTGAMAGAGAGAMLASARMPGGLGGASSRAAKAGNSGSGKGFSVKAS